jgi:hypothetical protein
MQRAPPGHSLGGAFVLFAGGESISESFVAGLKSPGFEPNFQDPYGGRRMPSCSDRAK